MLGQEIGWVELIQSDLFCVKFDVEPQLCTQVTESWKFEVIVVFVLCVKASLLQ